MAWFVGAAYMPPVATTRKLRYNGKIARNGQDRSLQTCRKFAFSQLLLTSRLFVGRGLDPSLPFCGNCKTPRRGGVTPPYGAIKNHCTVGAGYAPPAGKWWRKNHGLVCRGGIYAARCSHPDITIYRENRTGRIYASPTNLPEICIFHNCCLPPGYS